MIYGSTGKKEVKKTKEVWVGKPWIHEETTIKKEN